MRELGEILANIIYINSSSLRLRKNRTYNYAITLFRGVRELSISKVSARILQMGTLADQMGLNRYRTSEFFGEKNVRLTVVR